MKRELYNKWLEALETAPKTKGRLKDNDGMCCLGVLCDISQGRTWRKTQMLSNGGQDVWYKNETVDPYQLLPANLARELGIADKGQLALSDVNDRNDTFRPVIEYLKANEGKLFPIED